MGIGDKLDPSFVPPSSWNPTKPSAPSSTPSTPTKPAETPSGSGRSPSGPGIPAGSTRPQVTDDSGKTIMVDRGTSAGVQGQVYTKDTVSRRYEQLQAAGRAEDAQNYINFWGPLTQRGAYVGGTPLRETTMLNVSEKVKLMTDAELRQAEAAGGTLGYNARAEIDRRARPTAAERTRGMTPEELQQTEAAGGTLGYNARQEMARRAAVNDPTGLASRILGGGMAMPQEPEGEYERLAYAGTPSRQYRPTPEASSGPKDTYTSEYALRAQLKREKRKPTELIRFEGGGYETQFTEASREYIGKPAGEFVAGGVELIGKTFGGVRKSDVEFARFATGEVAAAPASLVEGPRDTIQTADYFVRYPRETYEAVIKELGTQKGAVRAGIPLAFGALASVAVPKLITKFSKPKVLPALEKTTVFLEPSGMKATASSTVFVKSGRGLLRINVAGEYNIQSALPGVFKITGKASGFGTKLPKAAGKITKSLDTSPLSGKRVWDFLSLSFSESRGKPSFSNPVRSTSVALTKIGKRLRAAVGKSAATKVSDIRYNKPLSISDRQISSRSVFDVRSAAASVGKGGKQKVRLVSAGTADVLKAETSKTPAPLKLLTRGELDVIKELIARMQSSQAAKAAASAAAKAIKPSKASSAPVSGISTRLPRVRLQAPAEDVEFATMPGQMKYAGIRGTAARPQTLSFSSARPSLKMPSLKRSVGFRMSAFPQSRAPAARLSAASAPKTIFRQPALQTQAPVQKQRTVSRIGFNIPKTPQRTGFAAPNLAPPVFPGPIMPPAPILRLEPGRATRAKKRKGKKRSFGYSPSLTAQFFKLKAPKAPRASVSGFAVTRPVINLGARKGGRMKRR